MRRIVKPLTPPKVQEPTKSEQLVEKMRKLWPAFKDRINADEREEAFELLKESEAGIYVMSKRNRYLLVRYAKILIHGYDKYLDMVNQSQAPKPKNSQKCYRLLFSSGHFAPKASQTKKYVPKGRR